jgi:hypothetical protein
MASWTVGAILASGRYTEDELLDLAAHHDPSFDRAWFAEASAAIDRLPESLFRPSAVAPDEVSELAELADRYSSSAASRCPVSK